MARKALLILLLAALGASVYWNFRQSGELAELDSLRQQNSGLNSELEKANAKLDRFRKRNLTHVREQEKLVEELGSQLTTERDRLSAIQTQLRGADEGTDTYFAEEANRKLGDQRRVVGELQSQLTLLNQQLAQDQRALSENRRNAALKSQLALDQASKRQLEAQLREQRVVLNGMQRDAQNQTRQKSSRKAQIDQLREQERLEREKISALQKQHQEQKSLLDDLSE